MASETIQSATLRYDQRVLESGTASQTGSKDTSQTNQGDSSGTKRSSQTSNGNSSGSKKGDQTSSGSNSSSKKSTDDSTGNSNSTKSSSETRGGSSEGVKDSIQETTGKTTRDLLSNSVTTRTGNDYANVGFKISFSVPILGRFPATTGTNCQ